MNKLAAGCLFLLATIVPYGLGAELPLYIYDPLTNGKSSAGLVQGGSFGAEGWTSTTDADRLYYILPEGTREGKIEYYAKGYRTPLFGDMRKNITGVYDVFRPRNNLKDASCICNGITFRIYAADRVKDGTVRQQEGQAELKINGKAYSPNGGEGGAVDALSPALDWDPNTWYKMEIVWTPTQAVYLRDNNPYITIKYSDKNLFLRHVYLNADYYHQWNGIANITHKEVRLYSDVAVAGLGEPLKNFSRPLELCVSPNPFHPSTHVTFNANHPIESLTIFDVAGSQIARFMDLNSSRFAWSAPALPAGIYVARVRQANHGLSKIIFLQR